MARPHTRITFLEVLLLPIVLNVVECAQSKGRSWIFKTLISDTTYGHVLLFIKNNSNY